MKRVGYLWDELIRFENLLRAAETACKGKRLRPAVVRFHFDLERELWRLHEDLAAKTYRPGPYRTFWIQEPKARQISAAPYRDRVVHHALTQVLEPQVLQPCGACQGAKSRSPPCVAPSPDGRPKEVLARRVW